MDERVTFAGRYCTRVPERKHRVAAGQLSCGWTAELLI